MAEKNADWMKVNADGSTTVTLSRPLEINGAKVSYLTVREPTLDDEIVASHVRGNDLERERAFFANLCTVAPADFNKISSRDYRRVGAAVSANFSD
jgi:hypothetical protein